MATNTSLPDFDADTWTDERVERTLVAMGRNSRGLNATQRASVRNALLQEATRARASRMQSRQRFGLSVAWRFAAISTVGVALAVAAHFAGAI